MAEPADHVADRLAAQGVGTLTVDLFSHRFPDSPATCIGVKASGGPEAARAFGESTPPIARFPEIQVMVRGATVPLRDAKIALIRTALDFKTWTESGVTYVSKLAYEPIDLGEDENQRSQVSMVFRLTQL